MTRSTIRQDGCVTYRTSLFAYLNRAQAFARCLTSNSRFESVLVHASATAKTPKWFVTFLPTNSDRADALHAIQWDVRAQRAQEQEFIFWSDPDTRNLYWYFSVASGETYEVTLGSCSCPDYIYRCQNAGIQCKHMQAWSLQRAAGTLGQTDKKTPALNGERREELRKLAIATCDVSRDF